MLLIIVILTIHWLFDFVLQPRRIADNKWHSFDALTDHVLIYTGGVVLMTCAILFMYPFAIINTAVSLFVALNVLVHGAIDFVTSKVSHKYYAAGRTKAFFVTVGFDQLLHFITILLSLQFILGLTIR